MKKDLEVTMVKKWIMPARAWKDTLNPFATIFEHVWK